MGVFTHKVQDTVFEDELLSVDAVQSNPDTKITVVSTARGCFVASDGSQSITAVPESVWHRSKSSRSNNSSETTSSYKMQQALSIMGNNPNWCLVKETSKELVDAILAHSAPPPSIDVISPMSPRRRRTILSLASG